MSNGVPTVLTPNGSALMVMHYATTGEARKAAKIQQKLTYPRQWKISIKSFMQGKQTRYYWQLHSGAYMTLHQVLHENERTYLAVISDGDTIRFTGFADWANEAVSYAEHELRKAWQPLDTVRKSLDENKED